MNRHQSGTHKEHAGHEGKFPLVTDLRREKRSQDIGELEQFALGGNNKQRGATASQPSAPRQAGSRRRNQQE